MKLPLPAQGQQRVRFDHDVRPILSNHCWSCHGPDEVARQAGLRLDRENSATAAVDSGRIAVVPEKPDEIELIARIHSHDADLQMPPAMPKKPITDQQKLVLLSKRLECCFSEKILACHFTAGADRASNFVATFARTWAIQRKPTLWRAWLRSVAGEARAKVIQSSNSYTAGIG